MLKKKRLGITTFAFQSQLYTDTYTGGIAHKSRAQESFWKDGSGFKSDTTTYWFYNLSMLPLKPHISHL